MGFKERIDGNEPSYIWEEDNIVGYTTNYGGVQMTIDTGEVVDACMGVDRNGKHQWLGFKIADGEFMVWVDRLGGSISQSLYSPKYPYKQGNNSLTPASVFRSLAVDENYSVAGVQSKKALVQLMISKLNLSKEDKQELKILFGVWRKPIVTSVERTPIVKGE